VKVINPSATALAEEFTAIELAHKLDAATARGSIARDRLRIAWDALRKIAKGEAHPERLACEAVERIKTP